MNLAVAARMVLSDLRDGRTDANYLRQWIDDDDDRVAFLLWRVGDAETRSLLMSGVPGRVGVCLDRAIDAGWIARASANDLEGT